MDFQGQDPVAEYQLLERNAAGAQRWAEEAAELFQAAKSRRSRLLVRHFTIRSCLASPRAGRVVGYERRSCRSFGGMPFP